MHCRTPFDIPAKLARIMELEEKMTAGDFWSNREKANTVIVELNTLKGVTEALGRLQDDLEEAFLFCQLGGEDDGESLEEEAAQAVAQAENDYAELEMRIVLGGEHDGSNAILSLHAGAGGTEAQDWVEMLLRMYTRWAEKIGFKLEVISLLPGDEAGVKAVTVLVRGENAFGKLKSEKGIHRLVRISPFDSSSRRHTSFASVEVLPEIEDDTEIEIDPSDLRVDTYRASGAGGQHVNKTDSAVRITHLPTGVVVECQNERSQHSNRETALKVLRSRLFELEEERKAKELAELRGEHREIAFGSQIRSYVFHPYSLVKDHRTNEETGNVAAVMDGDLDSFIYAYLRQTASIENN